LFNDINADALVELRSRGRDGNQSTDPLTVHIGDTSQLQSSDYELTFIGDTEVRVRRVSGGQMLGPLDLSVTVESGPGYPASGGPRMMTGPASVARSSGCAGSVTARCWGPSI